MTLAYLLSRHSSHAGKGAYNVLEALHGPDSTDHPGHRRRPWWERRPGAASKDLSLGPLGNSIAGALGGGVGGQILNAILGIGGTAAASGMDIGSVVSAFLTGGVSGGVTALIVGFLKSRMAA